MTDMTHRLAENLARIREQIASAAHRSGRTAESVTLVAVTKYAGPAEARALAQAGCLDLGESRPQELWRKAEALRDLPVRWHLVGHLQRNKARRSLPLVSLIHSGDSLRLLAALDQCSAQLARRTAILVEVNISGEAAKHGFPAEQLQRQWDQIVGFEHLQVQGLMAMAGLNRPPQQTRADFVRLRQLRDRLQAQSPSPVALRELSMGMSGDFEAAIEEGATLVRIGSALFEGFSP